MNCLPCLQLTKNFNATAVNRVHKAVTNEQTPTRQLQLYEVVSPAREVLLEEEEVKKKAGTILRSLRVNLLGEHGHLVDDSNQ